VTGADNAGNTVATTLTFVDDSTGPTGAAPRPRAGRRRTTGRPRRSVTRSRARTSPTPTRGSPRAC
jgi:hypothetical protein